MVVADERRFGDAVTLPVVDSARDLDLKVLPERTRGFGKRV